MRHQVIQFGEYVENYPVPVLNEREIRAAAGIMFLVLFLSLMLILFKQDFLLVKYVIVIFFTDFTIRVFISPRYSPVLILSRFIVSSQSPEYVGAAQKNFAWKIGLLLSALMFMLLVVLNTYSIITGVTCLVCLVFLFFESAFGICLGCLVYGLFYKKEMQYCAGQICKPLTKQAIQKISLIQGLITLVSIGFVVLLFIFFSDQFHAAPRNLKEIIHFNGY
jgi:hypothetical protein